MIFQGDYLLPDAALSLSEEQRRKIACTLVKNKKLVNPGDSVVISAGVPFGSAGTTNLLRLAEIIADKDLT